MIWAPDHEETEMAPIRESIEIARSPEDVFAYLNDLSRHPEWQKSLVSARVDTARPTQVGTRVTQTRSTPAGKRTMTIEVTEHNPPRSFAFRGIDGPIRPIGKGIIEPVGDGSRSRFTTELELTGHGLGKLLAPLIRGQARKEIPANQQRLKERLETGAA
jgi:uncharacterized membrane protein